MTEHNPSIVNLRIHSAARYQLKMLAAERGETMSNCLLALVAAARRAIEAAKKEKSQ